MPQLRGCDFPDDLLYHPESHLWFAPIAIAAGNAVVLKPSEKDPSAALWLAVVAVCPLLNVILDPLEIDSWNEKDVVIEYEKAYAKPKPNPMLNPGSTLVNSALPRTWLRSSVGRL